MVLLQLLLLDPKQIGLIHHLWIQTLLRLLLLILLLILLLGQLGLAIASDWSGGYGVHLLRLQAALLLVQELLEDGRGVVAMV